MATLWLVSKGLYFLHAEFCTGFFSHAVALLKMNSFQNVFEDTISMNVKQFGSISDPTFCQA